MVELCLQTFEEISNLQKELHKANIEYQVCIDMGHYGIRPPYLVVDGVPLDEKRAKIWIKERRKNG